MFSNSNSYIEKEIVDKIKNTLDNLGIMYRVFSRIKITGSLKKIKE